MVFKTAIISSFSSEIEVRLIDLLFPAKLKHLSEKALDAGIDK
jgi:hypothetical protein